MLLRYLEVGQNMKSPKVSDNKYIDAFFMKLLLQLITINGIDL